MVGQEPSQLTKFTLRVLGTATTVLAGLHYATATHYHEPILVHTNPIEF